MTTKTTPVPKGSARDWVEFGFNALGMLPNVVALGPGFSHGLNAARGLLGVLGRALKVWKAEDLEALLEDLANHPPERVNLERTITEVRRIIAERKNSR